MHEARSGLAHGVAVDPQAERPLPADRVEGDHRADVVARRQVRASRRAPAEPASDPSVEARMTVLPAVVPTSVRASSMRAPDPAPVIVR